jgi:hypothetical protein
MLYNIEGRVASLGDAIRWWWRKYVKTLMNALDVSSETPCSKECSVASKTLKNTHTHKHRSKYVSQPGMYGKLMSGRQ